MELKEAIEIVSQIHLDFEDRKAMNLLISTAQAHIELLEKIEAFKGMMPKKFIVKGDLGLKGVMKIKDVNESVNILVNQAIDDCTLALSLKLGKLEDVIDPSFERHHNIVHSYMKGKIDTSECRKQSQKEIKNLASAIRTSLIGKEEIK
jgi:hypothetical protein